MNTRTTLLDARMSRLPQAIGSCADGNQLLISTINEATRRLLNDESQPDEGWWGTWAVIVFNLTQADPYFTTPRGVARVTALDVCKRPVLLKNQFYEYLEFGNGLRPLSCRSNGICENLMAFDRGTAVTFRDISTDNRKIRVYPTSDADVGKTVLIGGKDQYGNIIVSQSGFNQVQGELVVLASPFTLTDNIFTEISGIQKDITTGQVQFYEYDTVLDEQTAILTMEPSETSASYRRYFVNGLPCKCEGSETVQVSALVKLDFIPVVADTDYLLIGNLDALKEECQAVRLMEMDSVEANKMGQVHHATALRLLFGELDHFVGKERVSIAVPIFSGAKLHRQVV